MRDLTPCPDISIVIPAYCEEKLLPACLGSIRDQQGGFAIEVIVAVLPGGDQTEAIARESGAIVISQPKKGIAYNRIAGFDAARAAIIATTDADTRLPANWVETMLGHFQRDPSLVAVSGPMRFYSSSWPYHLGNRLLIPLTDIIYRVFAGYYPFRGTNLAVRKDAYLRSGGFRPIPLEDVELSRRFHPLGRINYDFSLAVRTSDRRFRARLFRFLGEWTRCFFQVILLSKKSTNHTYDDIR